MPLKMVLFCMPSSVSFICEYRDLIFKVGHPSCIIRYKGMPLPVNSTCMLRWLTFIFIWRSHRLCAGSMLYAQTLITSADWDISIVFNVLNFCWKHTSWWVTLLIEVPWITYWTICVYDTTALYFLSIHTACLILLALIHTNWCFSLPP